MANPFQKNSDQMCMLFTIQPKICSPTHLTPTIAQPIYSNKVVLHPITQIHFRNHPLTHNNPKIQILKTVAILHQTLAKEMFSTNQPHPINYSEKIYQIQNSNPLTLLSRILSKATHKILNKAHKIIVKIISKEQLNKLQTIFSIKILKILKILKIFKIIRILKILKTLQKLRISLTKTNKNRLKMKQKILLIKQLSKVLIRQVKNQRKKEMAYLIRIRTVKNQQATCSIRIVEMRRKRMIVKNLSNPLIISLLIKRVIVIRIVIRIVIKMIQKKQNVKLK